jgi:DNA adenine methylase
LFKWHQESRPNTLTDIQRAARFYYLQHHAFGGRIEGQTFGTATTAPAINLLRIEETLSAVHLRLASGTTVENLPWKDCLERYDRPHTFVYADPPYWQTEGYGVPFPFEEYLSMAEAMRTMKGKMMVSINDHPDIRRAFAGLHMLDLEITYSLGSDRTGRGAARELVITNWSPDAFGQLF